VEYDKSVYDENVAHYTNRPEVTFVHDDLHRIIDNTEALPDVGVLVYDSFDGVAGLSKPNSRAHRSGGLIDHLKAILRFAEVRSRRLGSFLLVLNVSCMRASKADEVAYRSWVTDYIGPAYGRRIESYTSRKTTMLYLAICYGCW